MAVNKIYKLESDGSCPVNPGGTGAYGYALYSRQNASGSVDWKEIESGHGILGKGRGMSNNAAEHGAVTKGMEAALKICEPFDELFIYSDSKLVVNHLNGIWKGRANKAYYKFYLNSMTALHNLHSKGVIVKISWIPREENQRCDGLSKCDQK
jgi:ribonuclease HI